MYSDVIISATSRASREDNQTDRQTETNSRKDEAPKRNGGSFPSQNRMYKQYISVQTILSARKFKKSMNDASHARARTVTT